MCTNPCIGIYTHRPQNSTRFPQTTPTNLFLCCFSATRPRRALPLRGQFRPEVSNGTLAPTRTCMSKRFVVVSTRAKTQCDRPFMLPPKRIKSSCVLGEGFSWASRSTPWKVHKQFFLGFKPIMNNPGFKHTVRITVVSQGSAERP